MRTIARRKPTLFINIHKLKRAGIILGVILALTLSLVITISRSEISENIWRNISTFFFGFDVSNVGSIITEIPIINVVNSSYIALNANIEDLPVQPRQNRPRLNFFGIFENDRDVHDVDLYPRELGEDEFPIEIVNAGTSGTIFVNNETNIDIDIYDFLERPISFDFSGDGPHILIIHTHTTEAFTAPGKTWYHITNNKRSHNENENIVAVGVEIANVLRENGFNVVHNTSVHDYPSFNGSYAASFATIDRYLRRYPSIQLVLDVHRDAIVRQECGTKIKLLGEINNEDVAQVMFVVGTNAGGLSHDYWRDNLALVARMQQQMVTDVPGFVRPINLRRERFNQHTTRGSMLIEVGTSGNTLNEAILGGRVAAQQIAEVLNEFK